MTKFFYGADKKGKLVRDKIAQDTLKEGHKVQSRKIAGDELLRELLKKFREELGELENAFSAKNPDDEKAEIADLQTLLDAYIRTRGFDECEIDQIKQRKIAKKGGFDKGSFIEWVDLKPDAENYDFWLNYFRENAERYPEEKEAK